MASVRLPNVVKGDDANSIYKKFCDAIDLVEQCEECKEKVRIAYLSAMIDTLEIFSINEITDGGPIYDQVVNLVQQMQFKHEDVQGHG